MEAKSESESEAEASEDETHGDYEYHYSDMQEWTSRHTFVGFQGGYEQWGERMQEENGVPPAQERWGEDHEGGNKEWSEGPGNEQWK